MGEEGAASEVAKMVENGTVSPDKAANDVNGKIEEKKEAVEKMEEDVKDNENDKTKEVEVNEEADVKDNKQGEEDKGNIEPESEPMEVDDKKDANEETDDNNNNNNNNNNNTEANDSKEEEDNKEEENQEGDQEEIPEEKGSKKGSKKKGGEEKRNRKKNIKEPTTPVAPTIERPVRARKSVERLVAVIENDATKEFHILKGRGTVLKDIPNVSYTLSKKKVIDDTLKLLHTILFGRRGKAAQVKSNILQFSGFVWPENEEKHKLKVKEKLDRLNKEKLLEFCDIFDMTVSRANKEDIVVKLIDFMLSPHATSSELLAEKEESTKSKKRKSASKKSASTPETTLSKSSSKKQKTKSINEEDKKRVAETDDSEEESDVDEKDNEVHEDVNGATEKSEDEKSEDNASEEHVSEPELESESEEESSKKRKRSSTKSKSSKKDSGVKPKEKKEVTTPKKTSSSPQKKKPVKSSISGSKVADQSDSGTKTFSRKNKKDAVEEKPAPKEKRGKKTVKEKPKSEKQKISDGDLRTAICEIFKEVDFNTATFTDIVKLLAKRFDTDLTSRKASIKLMIQEELTKIADEEEDEEEPAEKQASGQGVKA